MQDFDFDGLKVTPLCVNGTLKEAVTALVSDLEGKEGCSIAASVSALQNDIESLHTVYEGISLEDAGVLKSVRE